MNHKDGPNHKKVETDPEYQTSISLHCRGKEEWSETNREWMRAEKDSRKKIRVKERDERVTPPHL